MRKAHLLSVLVGLTVTALVTADAAAMYNPTTGRFLQRDPGPNRNSPPFIDSPGPPVGGSVAEGYPLRDQYADGLNLYQYVRSSVVKHVDSLGLHATESCERPAREPTIPDWSLAGVAQGIVATTKMARHPRPVECIFSYSKRTVFCVDGQYSYCCEAVSGRDEHMNSPGSQGVKDFGPLPVGEYLVEKSRIHPRNRIYWHNLRKKVGGLYVGYTDPVQPGNRSAFGFHPGTTSHGCVTVLDNDTNVKMPKPYGNECFKNVSFLIRQSKYRNRRDNGTARMFVQL